MKLYLQSACQFGVLALCCVLITVRESDSTFVPGRCLCLKMLPGVRGQLIDLNVHPKKPGCDKFTVLVTLKDGRQVCVNPEAPMGKQLIRCWERAKKLNRDVRLCLRRRRGKGRQHQRSRQRSRGQSRKASSSNSQ